MNLSNFPKSGFLLIAQTIILFNLQAQNSPIIRKKTIDKKGNINYIQFQKDKGYSLDNAKNALNESLELPTDTEMKLSESKKDKLGFVHQKFEQYYKGIKVEYAAYQVHSDRNGEKIKSLNGHTFTIQDLDINPKISEAEALEKAMEYVGANVYKWEMETEEEFIKKINEDSSATYFPKGELVICQDFIHNKDSMHLTYKFDIYAHTPLSRDLIYVDAYNGEIIHKNPIIKHLDINAHTRYSDEQAIETHKVNDSTFVLHDLTRGNGIYTYNLQNSGQVQDGEIANIQYNQAEDFEDQDDSWTDEEWNNQEMDNAALDAHWGAMMTFDYFEEFHERNGYDDNGGKMLNYVHAGSDYENAFWDGEKATFGDGSNNPLTMLDVIAHEYGHAVMGKTANLNYQDESGALNEGFSDIWAACVESFAAPEKEIWILGEDGGSPFRSMISPNTYFQPDTYLGDYWYDGEDDNGGVHYNSGVINHWFYMLCEGETGENDFGKNYQIEGIGMDKAAQIVYRTLTLYLTSTSDYQDAAITSIQAAEDLFGEDSDEVIQTSMAWYAAGIGGAEFSSDFTTFCSSASIQFEDQSFEAVSWNWIFEGGIPATSSEQNPIITYENPGSFNVSLTVMDKYGIIDTLTKTSYINSYHFDLTENDFETDLEEVDFANSWYSYNGNQDKDENGSDYQWNYINLEGANANSGNGYFSYYGSSNSAADDWLFSNCFFFEEGLVYDISYWYKVRDNEKSHNLTLYLMEETDTASIVKEIIDFEGLSSTSYQEIRNKISVESSGTYYLAWHIYSNANQGNFYIDDIEIEKASDYDAVLNNIAVDVPDCEFSESTPVTFTYTNGGNLALDSIALTFDLFNENLDSLILSDQRYLINIAPGETSSISIYLDLSQIGSIYNLISTLNLENDEDTLNNSISVSYLNTQLAQEDVYITQEENVFKAPSGFSTYQWYLDGDLIATISGSNEIEVEENGMYKVVVTNEQGCSASSEEILFEVTGIDDQFTANALNLFPNPTENNVSLEITDSNLIGNGMILLYNLNGQVMLNYPFQKTSDTFLQKISLTEFPAGLYLISINLNGYQIRKELVKL